MLEAALEYVSQGFRVFPVGLNKKPLNDQGFLDATETILGVREYWSKWPEAGIAIPTEGFVVLDFDKKSGGGESLKLIENKFGRLPKTRTHRTGGGGLHYLYKNTSGLDIRNTVCLGGYTGVDVRANGGYIVVPPSRHPSGKLYKVLDNSLIIPCPDFIIELIKIIKPSEPITGDGIIPNHQRNMALASIAGVMRRKGLTEEAIEVALLETNKRQCSPPLTEDEVRGVAHSIHRYSPAESFNKAGKHQGAVEISGVTWL